MNRVRVILFILVRSAFRGLQGSLVTTGVAVATIAVSLLLVGAFGLVISNMQGLLEGFGRDLRITAYLDSGLPAEAQRALADRIATVEGVENVELISEAQALLRFEQLQGGRALLEGLDENPLPASVDITLAPGQRTSAGLEILESSLHGLPGIEEVAHGQEWIEGYARAASVARSVGLGLGVVLMGATLLIVANTIRLAVYAREDELDILALVGASRTFVRVPFLLEGTLQGALGGLLAVVMLFVGFHAVMPQIENGLVFFLGHATPRFLDAGEILRVVLGGAGLGLFGSVSALIGWKG